MQTIEGHPLVGSPYVNVLATINIIIINDTKQNNKPNTDEKNKWCCRKSCNTF